MPTTTVAAAAEPYRTAGLSIIPVDAKSKRPRLRSWRRYATTIPTLETVARWFTDPGAAIGIVCGRVSGSLEVIDFDQRAILYETWRELVESQKGGLVRRLIIQRTQNDGRHAAYRCPAQTIPGSQKLAQRVGRNGRPETVIETRGEGGYVLAAPSPGYELIVKSFIDLPVITPEERDVLIEAARALNTYVRPENVVGKREARIASPAIRGKRPGDDFNARGNISEILEKHGWVRVCERGDFVHYRRPGKSFGLSASVIRRDG